MHTVAPTNPLSNGIKSVSIFIRLNGEVVSTKFFRSISSVQKVAPRGARNYKSPE